MTKYTTGFGGSTSNYCVMRDGERISSDEVLGLLNGYEIANKLLADERDVLQSQLDETSARLEKWQQQHLKTVAALEVAWRALPEGEANLVFTTLNTDSCASLAEIEARAIERAVDECAWYGDRVWMKIDEVREYAARLRQKGETP